MNTIEIVLICLGVIAFILSFFLPEGKKENSEEKISKDKINKLIEEEYNSSKQHLQEMVDETVNFTVEKATRSMERTTNEKMLALGEYSDSIMNKISTNHQETVFMYDMLTKSKEELLDTIQQNKKDAREANANATEALSMSLKALEEAHAAGDAARKAKNQASVAEEKMIAARRALQEVQKKTEQSKAAQDGAANREEYEEDISGGMDFEEELPENGENEFYEGDPDGVEELVEIEEPEEVEEFGEIEEPEEVEEFGEIEEPEEVEEFGEIEEPEEAEEFGEIEEPEEVEDTVDIGNPEEVEDAKKIEKTEKNRKLRTEKESIGTSVEKALAKGHMDRAQDTPANGNIAEAISADLNRLKKPGAASLKGESEAKAGVETIQMALQKATKEKKKKPSESGHESIKDSLQEKKSQPGKKTQGRNTARNEKENHNERILQMHKQGKSNVEIARQLGLGVGEVKLVIDLYEKR